MLLVDLKGRALTAEQRRDAIIRGFVEKGRIVRTNPLIVQVPYPLKSVQAKSLKGVCAR
jgi:hypothetical protein